MSREIELVQTSLSRLSPYGQAVQQYITSSLQRLPVYDAPDLVFIPYAGPFAGHPHVVEVKWAVQEYVPDVLLYGALERMNKVVAANPGTGLRYAFACSASLTRGQEQWANSTGISIFQDVKDAARLSRLVLKWAETGP